jgi:phosphoglycerate kinase
MVLSKKSIQDLNLQDLKGKRVLVRVDFNVPLDNGKITDDTRIKEGLPSIEYLIKNQARVILVTHLGRPKGEKKEDLKLTPIAKKLSELINKPIIKADDCIGPEVSKQVNSLKNGEILLLENIRFYKQETENNEDFAKELASFADLFVNDAFGAAHRSHASVSGVAKYIPAYAGFLMQKEINFLDNAIKKPVKPFVAIIGGAKISTKFTVLKSLLNQVDYLIIGGAMIFTLLKAQGYEIGKSLYEEEKLEAAKEFLAESKKSATKVILPTDQVVTEEISKDATSKIVDIEHIPSNMIGVDIGPKTIKEITNVLKEAGTILWLGPVGVFEIDQFFQGTLEIAKALAESKAITIIGGGDSVAAIGKAGLKDKMTHISTGGGASLNFLEGAELPGIQILEDKT